MFALEWCEFCWSVRRMLAHFGVAFRSIDLDAVEFQAGDRGGAIRGALTALTGANTLPQMFIGGELVGGATDLIEAWRTGRAQTLLERHGVAFDREAAEDPRTLSARVAAAAIRRVSSRAASAADADDLGFAVAERHDVAHLAAEQRLRERGDV